MNEDKIICGLKKNQTVNEILNLTAFPGRKREEADKLAAQFEAICTAQDDIKAALIAAKEEKCRNMMKGY